MKVQENRTIDQDGNVKCNLNAVVYALNCGADITYIQLNDMDSPERDRFNASCERFGLDYRMVERTINHDQNHELWRYDEAYDKINLLDYFLQRCPQEDKYIERVKYEVQLYENFNMTKLLRCMIWLVDFMNENSIFWGLGRGSSVSSYLLYLIELHLVDSVKYELDVNEFLKW